MEKYLNEYIQEINLIILDRRGNPIKKDKPFTVLTRPESVGGQEFDAVISIGLEDGVVPEKVTYAPLNDTLEQQALREMYLSFTRAKKKLILLNFPSSTPNTTLMKAIENGYLQEESAVH